MYLKELTGSSTLCLLYLQTFSQKIHKLRWMLIGRKDDAFCRCQKHGLDDDDDVRMMTSQKGKYEKGHTLTGDFRFGGSPFANSNKHIAKLHMSA